MPLSPPTRRAPWLPLVSLTHGRYAGNYDAGLVGEFATAEVRGRRCLPHHLAPLPSIGTCRLSSIVVLSCFGFRPGFRLSRSRPRRILRRTRQATRTSRFVSPATQDTPHSVPFFTPPLVPLPPPVVRCVLRGIMHHGRMSHHAGAKQSRRRVHRVMAFALRMAWSSQASCNFYSPSLYEKQAEEEHARTTHATSHQKGVVP